MHFGWNGQQWAQATPTGRRDHIVKLRRELDLYLTKLLQLKILSGKIQVDQQLFDEMVQNYYRDLSRISDTGGPASPDDFKQKAFYAFWLRKLKPVSCVGAVNPVDLGGLQGPWLNEFVAFYMSLVELDCSFTPSALDKMEASYIKDFLTYFRYKSVSPHALYLAFRSLYLVPVATPALSLP